MDENSTRNMHRISSVMFKVQRACGALNNELERTFLPVAAQLGINKDAGRGMDNRLIIC
jgi:hypothetical protein